MTPAEIDARARAVHLKRSDLAELSGLPPDTVGRTLNGRTDPRLSTTNKLAQALTAEELRLRDHLLALHGLPEPQKASVA